MENTTILEFVGIMAVMVYPALGYVIFELRQYRQQELEIVKSIAVFDEKFINIEKRMDNFEQKMDKLENKVIHIENKVSNIESKVIHIESKVGDIDKTLLEIKGLLSNNQ